MFTGIVTMIGTVANVQGSTGDLRVRIHCGWDDLAMGESVACGGACLTVVGKGSGWFEVDISSETIARTAPDMWNNGAKINLERALQMGDRLSGHLVTGHVDGLATVESVTPSGGSHVVWLSVPEELAAYIAPKGSVTLDGVSLTVNDVSGARFSVNIIPHTWENTTLGNRKAGGKLNLEVDLIARYVRRLMEGS